jgi:acyl carrier protein
MRSEEILSGLAEIIEEFTGAPGETVTLDASLADDLEIDSLSMVEIIVSAQDKFGVDIPDEEVKKLRTVQNVVSYVQQAQDSGVSAAS